MLPTLRKGAPDATRRPDRVLTTIVATDARMDYEVHIRVNGFVEVQLWASLLFLRPVWRSRSRPRAKGRLRRP